MTKIAEFLKICRACNNERTNLLNLFAADCEDEPTLGEKFTSCTSLGVYEDDDLPQNICYPCAKLLESAYKFNRLCRSTDSQLRKQLKSVKNMKKEAVEQKQDPFTNVGPPDSPLYLEETMEDEEDVFCVDNTVGKLEQEIEVLEGESVSDVQMKFATEVQSISEPANRQFTCAECEKKFFTEKALELHAKIQHKKGSSKVKVKSSKSINRKSSLDECTECDLVFGSRDEYREHMQLCHSTGSIDNTCDICGKRLRNRIAFKNHLKVHHAGNRPYVCEVCGKEYTEYRYIHRHMLYHQQTLFRCSEPNCKRTFNVKHKLVDHLRRHHQKFLTNIDVRKIQPDNPTDEEVEVESDDNLGPPEQLESDYHLED